MFFLRLTGPACKKLKQEKFLVLLRVKRRTMIKRMGLGKMLTKSQVKTGIQVVFRNHGMSLY